MSGKILYAVRGLWTWDDIVSQLIDPDKVGDMNGMVGFMPVFEDRARALDAAEGREDLILELHTMAPKPTRRAHRKEHTRRYVN